MSKKHSKILILKEKLKGLLDVDSERLLQEIIKDIEQSNLETVKPFDPVAGSGGDANYSRFYANNLENSVPIFSDGPYTANEDDNYFRGLPSFTNTY